jgi:hypothetical protein
VGSSYRFLDVILNLVSATGEPWLATVPARQGGREANEIIDRTIA